MNLDPKLREELAMKRYEASDRAGVDWNRRPEWIKQAFREAIDREHAAHRGKRPSFDPAAAGL